MEPSSSAVAPTDVQPPPDGLGALVPPLLIVVGLVGIVVPVLPGLVLVLAGVLVWALVEGSALAWASSP